MGARVGALLWVHASRIVGGTILALVALIAIRTRRPGALSLVWLCVTVGMLDTLNAIVRSVRFDVFIYPLGVNWVIVTMYVPALVVSSVLIFMHLLDPDRSSTEGQQG